MCEWLKQAVLKTALRETVAGVRIPLPPPAFASVFTAVEGQLGVKLVPSRAVLPALFIDRFELPTKH